MLKLNEIELEILIELASEQLSSGNPRLKVTTLRKTIQKLESALEQLQNCEADDYANL